MSERYQIVSADANLDSVAINMIPRLSEEQCCGFKILRCTAKFPLCLLIDEPMTISSSDRATNIATFFCVT